MEAAVSGYAAAVSQLDQMVGELLDIAQARGLPENTIVIFWSGDHGFSLGDGGSWGKWSNYDSATRIPLLMRIPGVGAGRTPALVEAVDMFPTLVELGDLPPPPQPLDGLSFAPLLDEPDRPWKTAVFTTYGNFRSVKDHRFNLIVDDRDGTAVLFDRTKDPLELVDVAASCLPRSSDSVDCSRWAGRCHPPVAHRDHVALHR